MQVFIVKLPRYSPEIQGSIEENEDGQEEIICRTATAKEGKKSLVRFVTKSTTKAVSSIQKTNGDEILFGLSLKSTN